MADTVEQPQQQAGSGSEALDEAERLLVAGSFAEAAEAAQRVLSEAKRDAAPRDDADDEGEDLTVAAAAVLLQARRFLGDSPAALRTLLESAFASLHAVPPEALLLWARLALAAGEAETARATLVEALAYEPGERLRHAQEALSAAARMLVVDVWTGALGDPAGALKWLAVGGVAVMTTESRRELMREVNERKLADEAAAVDKQRAEAQAAEAAATTAAAPAPASFRDLLASTPSWDGSKVAVRDAEAVPARPAEQAAKPRSVATSLRSLIQKGSAAARADPEAAFIYVVASVGALHVMVNERRALRAGIQRAGLALARLW